MKGTLNFGAELEARLRILLPSTYQVFDSEVQPVSMGSAGLKYGPDGKVLWNEMWGSFCDLAMAGGPPHRGTFLAPATGEQVTLQPETYTLVAEEICRGLRLVTGLYAEPSPRSGWVQMYCTSAAMAGWLARAIVMENVCAVGRGLQLHLPAGPAFRVEKESKNVITAVAKTSHYWLEHMSEAKHDEIARLLAIMDKESPLVYPSESRDDNEARRATVVSIDDAIHNATGLDTTGNADTDWIGLDCRTIPSAIWMMRALAVSNMLSRREGTKVFFPVPAAQHGIDHSVRAVIQAYLLENPL